MRNAAESGCKILQCTRKWLDLPGVTDANGQIIFTVDLSGNVKFRMTYEGSNQTITQNINNNHQTTYTIEAGFINEIE